MLVVLFTLIIDDNSSLANKCQWWGKDNGQHHVGKWGQKIDGILGSDQNETRFFNHPMFVLNEFHWLVGFRNRFECDDVNAGGTKVFGDDFWEIFVC